MIRVVGFLFGLNLKYATEKTGRLWISELLSETSTETARSSGEADIGWVLGGGGVRGSPVTFLGQRQGTAETQVPLWLSP